MVAPNIILIEYMALSTCYGIPDCAYWHNPILNVIKNVIRVIDCYCSPIAVYLTA